MARLIGGAAAGSRLISETTTPIRGGARRGKCAARRLPAAPSPSPSQPQPRPLAKAGGAGATAKDKLIERFRGNLGRGGCGQGLTPDRLQPHRPPPLPRSAASVLDDDGPSEQLITGDAARALLASVGIELNQGAASGGHGMQHRRSGSTTSQLTGTRGGRTTVTSFEEVTETVTVVVKSRTVTTAQTQTEPVESPAPRVVEVVVPAAPPPPVELAEAAAQTELVTRRHTAAQTDPPTTVSCGTGMPPVITADAECQSRPMPMDGLAALLGMTDNGSCQIDLGHRKVNAKLQSGQVVIHTGGGYLKMDDFLKRYRRTLNATLGPNSPARKAQLKLDPAGVPLKPGSGAALTVVRGQGGAVSLVGATR